MLGVGQWCVCVCVCSSRRPQQRGGVKSQCMNSQITEFMKISSLIISISKIISFEHSKSLVLLFIKPI